MLANKAAITRKCLKLNDSKNIGKLVICIRSTALTTLNISANGKALGTVKSNPDNKYASLEVPLGDSWKGTIESLIVEFLADKNTSIEMDWIRIQ
jgi:hypothetical protein